MSVGYNRTILGYGGMNDTLAPELLPENQCVLVEDCYPAPNGLLLPAPQRKVITDTLKNRFKKIWFMTTWNRGNDTFLIWAGATDDNNPEWLNIYYCSVNELLTRGASAIIQGKTASGSNILFRRLNFVPTTAQCNDIIFFFGAYYDVRLNKFRDVSFDGSFFTVLSSGSICGTFYRDRVVLVPSGERNLIKWSMPNEFDKFEEEDWVAVEPFDNDTIVAITSYLNSVVVFKRNHIYRVVDLPPSQIRTISTKYGCSSPHSVQTWRNYLFFINQLGHLCVSGGGDEDIKEISRDVIQNEIEKHQPEISVPDYKYFPPWYLTDELNNTVYSFNIKKDGELISNVPDLTGFWDTQRRRPHTSYPFRLNLFPQEKTIVPENSLNQPAVRFVGNQTEQILGGFLAFRLEFEEREGATNDIGVYLQKFTIPIFCGAETGYNRARLHLKIVAGDDTLQIPGIPESRVYTNWLNFFVDVEQVIANAIQQYISNGIKLLDTYINIHTNYLYNIGCSFEFFTPMNQNPCPIEQLQRAGCDDAVLPRPPRYYWVFIWATDLDGNFPVNYNEDTGVITGVFNLRICTDLVSMENTHAPVIKRLKCWRTLWRDASGRLYINVWLKNTDWIAQDNQGQDARVVLSGDANRGWRYPTISWWSYPTQYSPCTLFVQTDRNIWGSAFESITWSYEKPETTDCEVYLSCGRDGNIYRVATRDRTLYAPPLLVPPDASVEFGITCYFNTLHAPTVHSAKMVVYPGVVPNRPSILVPTDKALYLFLSEKGDSGNYYRYIRFDGERFSVFKDNVPYSPTGAFAIQNAIVGYIGEDTRRLVLFSEMPEYQDKIKHLPNHITPSPRLITRNAPLLPVSPAVALVRRVVVGVNNPNNRASIMIKLKPDGNTAEQQTFEFFADSGQKVLGLKPMHARYIQAEVLLKSFEQLQGLTPLVVEWQPLRIGVAGDAIKQKVEKGEE